MRLTTAPTLTNPEALAADLAAWVLDHGTPRIIVARESEHLLPWMKAPTPERLSTYWDFHPGSPSTDWERARAEREQRLGLSTQTVYGTLVIERDETPATDRFAGDSFYGSVALVVGDAAARRATFTPGDTVDNDFASTAPFDRLEDVVRSALLRRGTLMDELGSMPIDDAREAASRLLEHPGNTTYVEAQVAALKRDEITEARASMYNMPKERAVLDAASATGISVPPYTFD